jgi:hypothetical protein
MLSLLSRFANKKNTYYMNVIRIIFWILIGVILLTIFLSSRRRTKNKVTNPPPAGTTTTHPPTKSSYTWIGWVIGFFLVITFIVGLIWFIVWLNTDTEVQIVVTQKDNGMIIYSGPTPWKGAAYVLVDIQVVPDPEQCGKAVKVSCRSWTEDFYLVACGKGNVNFPPRERGKAVYVSAVK